MMNYLKLTNKKETKRKRLALNFFNFSKIQIDINLVRFVDSML